MRIPEQIKCDLCGATVPHEGRLIKIAIPLTADLRRPIVEAVERDLPKEGFLGIKLSAWDMLPAHWTLETCGCLLGLVPDLTGLVQRDVQRVLAERRAREAARSSPASYEEL